MTSTEITHETRTETKADGTEIFFSTVAAFREAERALGATDNGSRLHAHVASLVGDLGPREYTLTLACMLCGGPIRYETTVAAYAELRWPPRGICERH